VTTLTASPPAPPDRGLQEAHRAWHAEVGAALALAREPDSGIWDRWAAVQYLEREFMPRFEQELETVNVRLSRLTPEQAARVWAPAELLGFLRAYLVELARMAQSGVLFAVAAEKFVRAHECWCREVEEIGVQG